MSLRLAVQCSPAIVRVVAAEMRSAGRIADNSFELKRAVARTVSEGTTPGEVLGEIVASNQWKNLPASLVADRSSIEVRNLELPPVPDEEVADMVRLQAVRSFAASGERSVVDYVMLGRNDDGIETLAAAADSKTIAQICAAVAATGLQVDRIAIQSLASASLYRRAAADFSTHDFSDASVVSVIDARAEIGVIRDSTLRSIRTVKLPGPRTCGPAIAAEIRRSRLACGCMKDSPVIFLGSETDEFAGAIEGEGFKVFALDPLAIHGKRIDVDFGASESTELDHDFAALVGLIDAETRLVDGHDQWNVNFLSPRKRPEEKTNRTTPILIAVAAAMLIALLGLSAYWILAAKDRQIAEVQNQIDALGEAVDDAKTVGDEVAAIEKFLDADVVWLDEVRHLANVAPPSDQLILSDLRGSANVNGGGGQVEIKGRVVQPSVLGELATSAAGQGRRVIGDGASEIKTDDSYRWSFAQKILIDAAAVRDARTKRATATAEEASSIAIDEAALEVGS